MCWRTVLSRDSGNAFSCVFYGIEAFFDLLQSGIETISRRSVLSFQEHESPRSFSDMQCPWGNVETILKWHTACWVLVKTSMSQKQFRLWNGSKEHQLVRHTLLGCGCTNMRQSKSIIHPALLLYYDYNFLTSFSQEFETLSFACASNHKSSALFERIFARRKKMFSAQWIQTPT